ncbi:hypothetical protein L198_00624 [Cryptococcus wingfieldii CBS 7118]|uniref:Cytochrome P450 n=1 Tax=Cryptococcus wingfieldii CBS 7118 TaxID=1295528 RepID=A0A1E3K8P1_9TREE|nr:hypothetical protein L198_00624 [Cryptococcus wingfieldii CBS 7118]ODO08887.1 hypothetical protein L198_00624 [Cryptococcus wingfieldii CBS 7118]
MGLMDNTSIDPSALVSQLITSISWSSFAQASLALLLGFYLYSYWRYRSFSLHKLPGPPADRYFLGILPSLLGSQSEAPQTAWHAKYGPTLQTPFLPFPFYSSFQTTDPTALNYIVSHPDFFPKPEYIRTEIASVGGVGLVVAEGDQHRKQRKVLNGCFTPAAIAGMIVEGISDETPSLTPPQPMDQVAEGRKVDVMRYIIQATFDIIGLTGFGYQFNQLQQKGVEDELSKAYGNLYTASIEFPTVRVIPTKRMKVAATAYGTAARFGMRMIKDKKAAAKIEGVGKKDGGTDLISILALPPEQRLSDLEVVDQITTFMVAANDTTALVLTWCLYYMARFPAIQERLRTELSSVHDERPSLETLNSSPYLDAFVREVIRLSPSVPSSTRSAKKNAVIPLRHPVVGRDGKMMNRVEIPKGTDIYISIIAINTSPLYYGPDAAEFNPDRFLGPQAENDIPGVWGGSMSFFAGPRSCIGYRFALAELKTILFVLINGFEFAELPSKPVMERRSATIMRARVVGEESLGPQMPLLVKALAF